MLWLNLIHVNKTFYRKMSQSLIATKFVFRTVRPIALKFDSTAANAHAKFQSDMIIWITNLGASRYHEIMTRLPDYLVYIMYI